MRFYRRAGQQLNASRGRILQIAILRRGSKGAPRSRQAVRDAQAWVQADRDTGAHGARSRARRTRPSRGRHPRATRALGLATMLGDPNTELHVQYRLWKAYHASGDTAAADLAHRTARHLLNRVLAAGVEVEPEVRREILSSVWSRNLVAVRPAHRSRTLTSASGSECLAYLPCQSATFDQLRERRDRRFRAGLFDRLVRHRRNDLGPDDLVSPAAPDATLPVVAAREHDDEIEFWSDDGSCPPLPPASSRAIKTLAAAHAAETAPVSRTVRRTSDSASELTAHPYYPTAGARPHRSEGLLPLAARQVVGQGPAQRQEQPEQARARDDWVSREL